MHIAGDGEQAAVMRGCVHVPGILSFLCQSVGMPRNRRCTQTREKESGTSMAPFLRKVARQNRLKRRSAGNRIREMPCLKALVLCV